MSASGHRGNMLDRRQIAAVRESVRRDLGENPEWADLWNLHGLLEAYEGRLEKARASFAEALRRNPRYAAARGNLHWAEILLGGSAAVAPGEATTEAHASVLPAVRAVLSDAPLPAEWARSHPTAAFLALVLTARRDPEGADEARQELGRVLPGADGLLEAAGVLERGRLRTVSLAVLGEPDWMNPGYADLLHRAGRLESVAGREDEALRLHALAALYGEGRAAFLVELAEALGRADDAEGCLAALREAVRIRPDWYRSHFALGYELSVRGDLEGSLAHFEEALRVRPGYADVQYQYGLLLHAGDRNEEAVAAMDRALAINAGYVVARIAIANLLFDLGRPADAAPHYERVFADGLDTPVLAGRFGYSLHRAGERHRAEELFLQAITRDRDRPELLALYGQFLAETGRRVEARAVWDRALETRPPDRIRAEIETMRDEISVEKRKDDA